MGHARMVRAGGALVLAVAGALGYLIHTGAADDAAAPAPSSTDVDQGVLAVPGQQVRAADQRLAELSVAPAGSMSGYSDEQFPHWSSQGQGCDTRDRVLQRQGQDVSTGDDCAVSGRWYSPYDGATWGQASEVDIDHLVPRANAWTSGAASWTQQRREAFANDLTRPELVAVTNSENRSKGDSAPDEWKPPLRAAWCRYATDWIAVKHHYQLTVTGSEREALADILDTCPGGGR